MDKGSNCFTLPDMRDQHKATLAILLDNEKIGAAISGDNTKTNPEVGLQLACHYSSRVREAFIARMDEIGSPDHSRRGTNASASASPSETPLADLALESVGTEAELQKTDATSRAFRELLLRKMKQSKYCFDANAAKMYWAFRKCDSPELEAPVQ
jgi:hypothetical protein